MKTILWTLAGVCALALGVAGVGLATARRPLAEVRMLAVQHQGRLKPFDSFARESLWQITGRAQVGREDPVRTVLSMLSDPGHWESHPLLSVPFGPLREGLGMEPQATHIAYSELIATRRLMQMLPAIVQKQQRDEKLSMLENETMDAYGRFVALTGLFQHDLALLPPVERGGRTWLPVLKPVGYPEQMQLQLRETWAELVTAAREGSSGVDAAAARFSGLLRATHPQAYPPRWRLRMEVIYNTFAPFAAARLLYLVAAVGLALGWSRKRFGWTGGAGMGVLGLAFLVHGAGILARVVIGGRPPVSNFYETMLWLPFVGVGLALLFERIYRVRLFGLAAAILSFVTLLLADHLPLNPSISPVVAVLRSNLWLTIHVLAIVASYGALALATVLAHLYGAFFLAGGRRHPALDSMELFLYRAIQVGVVLLASGIILGGVWANASWGRYWGWDPKETWALITLLWFLALLHGRFAGWIRGMGLALSTIGGFFLLLMTYYGVSFYLVGLHSYAGGNAKPLPPLLVGYLVAEVAFMAWVGWARWARREVA